ncbi:MAG TPA: FtsX-like permease family protein [Chryseolinea sp.]
MVRLNSEHVDFIVKDLNYRGIVIEGFQDEIIDHFCSAVEAEMEGGKRFLDAYHDVLRSFGSTSGLRRTQHQSLLSENKKASIMFKNYLTIAWRNLRKHSFYSLINIVGLAIGVAASLVITLFVMDELNYDTYNDKADRIYRVEADVKFGGNHFQMTYRSAPEASTLIQDFPEVESAVRFRSVGSYLVRTPDSKDNLKEKYVTWADSTFFNIFSVKVIEGDARTALNQPASIAISQRIAEKYFPGKSALGQSLLLDNNYNAKITAVYENIPAASHFHFDIIFSTLGSWPIAKEANSTSFMSENFNTYILLRKGADPKALEQKFPAYLDKYMGPEITQLFGENFTMEKFRASGNKYDMSLRPLKDIHLHSNIKGEFEPNGNITYVYLFAIVALFILTIACINFMNLSTARSSNRAKEVGVRKVMGSIRAHLIRQFLTESILITIVAFVFSLGLAYLSLPAFNMLSSKQLIIPISNPSFYLLFFGGSVVIGLVAGLYPSFFLSAFKPVNVLKGNVALGMKSGFIRSSLVVFQFVVSVFLIIGTISIYRQLHFIQTKKLGFEKEQVIIVHDAYGLRPNNVIPFKNEVSKLSSIESGTVTGFVPVESEWSWRSNSSCWRDGQEANTENMVAFQQWRVDHDYIKTLRLIVNKGREFSTEFPSDSSAVILNQTAVDRLGLGKDPIGERIETFGESGEMSTDNRVTWTIIGVVDDFHFSSMREGISALGLFLGPSDGSVCFRFKPENTTDVIQSIEQVWKQMTAGQPFQYSFLDEDFESMYQSEEKLGNIFGIFSFLAIIIACLGLFALTAFTAEQRTKEIGIRKVLGASVRSVVLMLSKDFSRLVLIAFGISSPLAWFAVNWWLEGYTYKVDINVFVFLIAGIIAFVIAITTMGYQAFRAANVDPVKSLKSE